MAFDFNRYFADFNRNDDEAMVQTHYAPDVVIGGPDGELRGREAWLSMLKASHAGVTEELRPLLLVREGDKAMAEVDAVFTARADRQDFMFGPLKAGESVSVRFMASYLLRGDQIAQLHLAFWPPGKPVAAPASK